MGVERSVVQEQFLTEAGLGLQAVEGSEDAGAGDPGFDTVPATWAGEQMQASCPS